jgi:hypothetical protein
LAAGAKSTLRHHWRPDPRLVHYVGENGRTHAHPGFRAEGIGSLFGRLVIAADWSPRPFEQVAADAGSAISLADEIRQAAGRLGTIAIDLERETRDRLEELRAT